jgi:hypothetical protein
LNLRRILGLIEDAVMVIRVLLVVGVAGMMLMVMAVGQAIMVVLMMVADGGMVGVRVILAMSVGHKPRRAHGSQSDDSRHQDRRIEPPFEHSCKHS